jgi:hypothetical protein
MVDRELTTAFLTRNNDTHASTTDTPRPESIASIYPFVITRIDRQSINVVKRFVRWMPRLSPGMTREGRLPLHRAAMLLVHMHRLR